ncbi:MAG: Killer protein [Gammaproteobacteria bacterium]|nr:Killer protein [Gammaproteobacteria bacterium]
MIRRFRHKGLERLYRLGSAKGVQAAVADKIARILARLDVATGPEQMGLPGWRLHPLKGDLRGFWSVSVNANWRIVFRFDGADAVDVDLVDYH